MWFVLCANCHEDVSVSASTYDTKHTITRHLRAASHSSRLDRSKAIAVHVRSEQTAASSWWLCLHTWNKVGHLRARQWHQAGPFRIASKGLKRADHAAGTDFTRPRHGSYQLSLIEILKCNASLAAAATEMIPMSPRNFAGDKPRMRTGNSFHHRDSLAHNYKRHFMRVIVFLIGYLGLHNKKFASFSSTSVLCILQNRETFTAIRMYLASEARLINVISAHYNLHSRSYY